jgi:hypothetical protein
MSDPRLQFVLSSRDRNIATMAEWSWKKTAKHLGLIDTQLGWACEQRCDDSLILLEEYRNQVVAARLRKLDNETLTVRDHRSRLS